MVESRRLRGRVEANLGSIGAALAFLVAGIHLFHPSRGFPRLVTILLTGSPSLLLNDPRPVVFVLSALAIVLGINLVLLGVARKPIYVLGMILVATYVVGYFAWHLSGHGGFLPGREPLFHGLGPVEAVVAHLTTDRLAALSKLAEIALFAVLVVLYRREE